MNFMTMFENTELSVFNHPLMLSAGIIISVLLCFLGYKFIRIWSALAGFWVGFLFSGAIFSGILGKTNMTAIVIISIIVGIVLAFVSFRLYEFGVFLYVGYLAFKTVCMLFPVTFSWMVLIMAIIIGIVAGVLAIRMIRPTVIIATSLAGGITISRNLLAFAGNTNFFLLILLAAIIAGIGMAVQFKTTTDKRDESKNMHHRAAT